MPWGSRSKSGIAMLNGAPVCLTGSMTLSTSAEAILMGGCFSILMGLTSSLTLIVLLLDQSVNLILFDLGLISAVSTSLIFLPLNSWYASSYSSCSKLWACLEIWYRASGTMISFSLTFLRLELLLINNGFSVFCFGLCYRDIGFASVS